MAEKGCVFAPGHTGDFITGGHIPGIAFTGDKFTRAALAEQIFSPAVGVHPLVDLASLLTRTGTRSV